MIVIVAIPYSNHDANDAFRLLRWIRFLSRKNRHSMRQETLLLVPSRHASQKRVHGQICAIAEDTFREVHCCTPATEYEKGWPGACNFMMKEALEHVESEFGDDMLLLEPDATPLCPDWCDQIKEGWRKSREGYCSFMGAYCPQHVPHMSGIGVYGSNWRAVAPKLAQVQDVMGWDIFAADEMVPRTAFTHMIQHIQWSTNGHLSYEALTFDKIHPLAVIFHQDKAGRVIKLCDEKFWRGEADAAIEYSRPFEEPIVEMKYFFNHNQNRDLPGLAKDIIFEPFDQLAGTWRGIYATDKESEVLILSELSHDPSTGIVELTEEEYAERTKKKVMRLRSSPDLVIPQRPAAMVQSQINPNPAVLVDEPANSTIPVGEHNVPVVENINSVIKLGKVRLPEHVKATIKKTNRRKAA